MFRRISTASLLKCLTKFSLANLTPLKIPLAGLGVALLAMGLPVFPAAAVGVTMTLSDGDENNANANWTATVCYDTANPFELRDNPFFINYRPSKMRFILEPNLNNPLIGTGGTIFHEDVSVIFQDNGNANFTVNNDDPEEWVGQLDGKEVLQVVVNMVSSEPAKFDSFDINHGFDFNPISFDGTDFGGGAGYTYSNGDETQGFDGTFYSFVEDEPCPFGLEPTEHEVEIDIKPGSFPNSINLGSGGTTPVAILGSDELDVNDIDIATLTLGTAGIKTVGKTDKILCSIEDVSGDFSGGLEGAPDGFLDLVCHFITVDIIPEAGDTEATVSGDFLNGDKFDATDPVNIVP